MSLDTILHLVGFGFVIAIWLAVLLGIGQLCRALRALLRENVEDERSRESAPAFTVETAPRAA